MLHVRQQCKDSTAKIEKLAAALRDQVFELRGTLAEKAGADGDLLLGS